MALNRSRLNNKRPTYTNTALGGRQANIGMNRTAQPTYPIPPDSPLQPGDRCTFPGRWKDRTGTVLELGRLDKWGDLEVEVKPDGEETIWLPAHVPKKIFDYAALDSETRIVVQQKTGEIKTLMRRAAQDIIDIGRHLIEIKERLGHGNFGKWLSIEFGWSESLALKMMQVSRSFKSVTVTDLEIGAKALYLLAAPSTPESAREEAIELAQSGQPVTHQIAKAIVADHKGTPPRGPVLTPREQPTTSTPPVSPHTGMSSPPPLRYGHLEDDYRDEVEVIELDTGSILDETPEADMPPSLDQVQADLQRLPPESRIRTRLQSYVEQQQAVQAEIERRKQLREEQRQKRQEALLTPPPSGKYRCIVIDPPYETEKIERDVRPNQGKYLDYPTMTIDDIAALPVPQLAADDGCHLYLWTTHKYLPTALRLAESWGFGYQCLLTWVKPTGMTPYHFMFNTEHVIFAARGGLRLIEMGLKLSFEGFGGRHSEKPDAFYDRVELASPGPRLEMFARQPRDGWTVWGNEVSHDQQQAAS